MDIMTIFKVKNKDKRGSQEWRFIFSPFLRKQERKLYWNTLKVETDTTKSSGRKNEKIVMGNNYWGKAQK